MLVALTLAIAESGSLGLLQPPNKQPLRISNRISLMLLTPDTSQRIDSQIKANYRLSSEGLDASDRLPSWSSTIKSADCEMARVPPSPNTEQKTPGWAEPNPYSGVAVVGGI